MFDPSQITYKPGEMKLKDVHNRSRSGVYPAPYNDHENQVILTANSGLGYLKGKLSEISDAFES